MVTGFSGLLTATVFLPAVGALVILLAVRGDRNIRVFAVLVALADFVLTLLVFSLFKQGERDNFSYYLLEGEIELHANKQQQNVITSGTDRALYAMAQLQPRQFSATAKTDAVVFQIQRDTLDRLMVLQETDDSVSGGGIEVDSSDVEVSDLDDEEDVDWMTRGKSAPAS